MKRTSRGSISPPPFTRQEIIEKAESLAERFLLKFWEGMDCSRLVGISFDVVYDQLIYPEYEILLIEDQDLGFDEDGEKIFGKFVPQSNTAYTDCSLQKDPRLPFTRWHEVGGHAVLQGDWLRRHMAMRTNQAVITTESMLSQETIIVLERQANLFAAHAAVPTRLLAHVILDVLDPYRPFEYRGRGIYTFNVYGRTKRREIEDFPHFARTLGSFLQHRFGWISAEAISYRLLEMNVIRDLTSKPLELRRVGKRTSGNSPIGAGLGPITLPTQQLVGAH